ncbi:MAG: ATP synthase F1 subunit gamma [Clostridiales bacterium]|nr:ATP synthase F1 subunit gamma [Clostridiales bacterium]
MKSIEGTRQITRSMRLVSIAKMQKAREAMEQNLPFLRESLRLASAAKSCLFGEKHPYLNDRPKRVTLMVVISGDRGLCGGFNAGIIRYAQAHLETLGHEVKVISIGAKAGDAFRRRRQYQQIASYHGLTDAPIYAEAEEIAGLIRGLYDAGEVDQALLCYTQFTSMLVQQPCVLQLLPVEVPADRYAPLTYEPEGAEMLEQIVPFYLASRLYGALLESSLSEQSARVLSMDGAVRTAGEMIQSLNVRYNKARQGVITQEITEIISGADASAGEGENNL